MHTLRTFLAGVLLLFALAFQVSAAWADGGWYVGASTGRSFIEADLRGSQSVVIDFDETATAWKAFGGYVVDLPLIDFGIEAGYVDFGTSSAGIPGGRVSLDSSGLNLWGIAGADLGPLGVYGKVGAIAWSLDGRITDIVDQRFDESGTDVAYGVGAKFMLWSLEFRAEYERYEVSQADNLSMLSVGASWVF